MDWKPLARAAGALAALAVVAAVSFVVLATVLARAGVPRSTAAPTAVGAVVAAVLAGADAYTPLGNTHRTELLRAKSPRALAADFGLTAAVGAAVGFAGAAVLLSGQTAGLARTAVVAVAVALGYGTFVARNFDVYRPGAGATEEFDPNA